MKTMNTQTPVREVAGGHPRIWSVLERFGIDYCCSGSQMLETACSERGIPVEVVLDEIARVMQGPNSGPDLGRLSMSELSDYIERIHHDYLKSELPSLRERLRRVIEVHAVEHPELVELGHLFEEFADELESHMVKEEQALFPAIREMERGGGRLPLEGPVEVMLDEHRSAGRALARMRELTQGFTPPDDACNTYRSLYQGLAELDRDMRRHVHTENDILFPAALRC